MKRALVIALVVVVLLTGMPVAMAMPAADCADCDLGMLLGGACAFAVLAATAGVALARRGARLPAGRDPLAGRLCASGLYRPPRLA